MATRYTVTAKEIVDRRVDNVSKGDAVKYEIDFTPWQEDNSTITSVTWTLEAGQAAISGQTLVSGVASALVTFSESGRSLLSVLAITATEKKKVWLEIYADDQDLCADDYGA